MNPLKQYKNYDEYVNHQLEKTNNPARRANWARRFRARVRAFVDIFKPYNFKKSNVLCVGARLGAECEAFASMGHDVVGIDLSPCPEHRVISMDMHDMKFKNDEFSLVFTNSFDHSLNPERLIKEISRVLQNDGLFLLQIFINHNSEYEVIDFNEQEVVELCNRNHLMLVSRSLTPHVLYKKKENEICLLFRNQKCPNL